MSFGDWDIDSYKTEHESEEHWQLRRSFMLAHKDDLPEDDVVCMAQVFTNIEFMGCRYPDETMTKVAELARGVVEQFREKKKNTLKRTFVAASDAASAKVKGKKIINETVEEAIEEIIEDPKPTIGKPKQSKNERRRIAKEKRTQKRLEKLTRPFGFVQQSVDSGDNEVQMLGELVKQPEDKDKVQVLESGNSSQNESQVEAMPLVIPPGPFQRIVIFLAEPSEGPVSFILRNASRNNFKVKWECHKSSNKTCCQLRVNNTLLATGEGATNKKAKIDAATKGVAILKASCCCVKVKAKVYAEGSVGTEELSTSTPGSSTSLQSVVAGEQLGTDNVGNKIMRLMGWTGGGLGSKAQGITEPVGVSLKVTRQGMGLTKGAPKMGRNMAAFVNTTREGLGHIAQDDGLTLFRKKAKTYIKSWMDGKGSVNEDLVFDSGYTADERKTLHEVAQAYRLKSKSYGKDSDRHLVISKKLFPWEVVNDLLSRGGSSEKYELIRPGT